MYLHVQGQVLSRDTGSSCYPPVSTGPPPPSTGTPCPSRPSPPPDSRPFVVITLHLPSLFDGLPTLFSVLVGHRTSSSVTGGFVPTRGVSPGVTRSSLLLLFPWYPKPFFLQIPLERTLGTTRVTPTPGNGSYPIRTRPLPSFISVPRERV